MFAEDCPVEDRNILSDGTKCKEVTKDMCKDSSLSVKTDCCMTCKSLIATPWLGPDCANGDSFASCKSLNTRAECYLLGFVCCETCCPILGADPGYSCTPSTTTSTYAPAHTTTSTTATTSTTIKTTMKPSTFKSTSPLTPILPTTNLQSANRTTMTSLGPSSQKVTTDDSKVLDSTTMQRPNHKLLFQITVQITNFQQTEFDCKDPDLQDQKSTKYLFFNVSSSLSFTYFRSLNTAF